MIREEGRKDKVQQYIQFSQKIIRQLYKHNNAKELSLAFRQQVKSRHENDSFLTYGEVDSSSFLQLLTLVDHYVKIHDKIFYDLGSGSGLACITAGLSHFSFASIHGIEIVPDLVELSNRLLQQLLEELNKEDSPMSTSLLHQPPSKKKGNPKAINSPFNIQQWIDNLLGQSDEMKIEQLANSLCKDIGHKEYRNLIKPHQSFLNLLRKHSERYLISDDNKSISRKIAITPSREEDETEAEVLQRTESEMEQVDQTAGTVGEDIDHSTTGLIIDPMIRSFYRDRLPPLSFQEGDIFVVPWWDTADIVYAASLLFTDEMMDRLASLVIKMKRNSIFITLKPLPIIVTQDNSVPTQQYFKLLHESFFKMSWQMAKVYIYQVCSEMEDITKV